MKQQAAVVDYNLILVITFKHPRITSLGLRMTSVVLRITSVGPKITYYSVPKKLFRIREVDFDKR